MIDIVLLEIENSGNLGAVARVMKNFGYERLVLINPKCSIDKDTKCRAKHAQNVLSKAKITNELQLGKYDYLIGTTAKIGSDYNLHRSPVTPEIFSKQINEIQARTKTPLKIGLLFGREGLGLSNKELEKCSFIVSIPSQAKYPTLNISHAAGIILYELSKYSKIKKAGSQIEMASGKDIGVILARVDDTLKTMEFSTVQKKETQRKVWKRMVSKAMLTKREAFALLGFFRKLIK